MRRSLKALEDLFRSENYQVLQNEIHPLTRFYDTAWRDVGEAWVSLLGECIYRCDARLFQHIIDHHGVEIMENDVFPCITGYAALDELTMDNCEEGMRHSMALYEILIQEGAPEKRVFRQDFVQHYMGPAWSQSLRSQWKALRAVVWCCKAIRPQGADGLEEILGKRLQAANTWDWEPPMKRCKY